MDGPWRLDHDPFSNCEISELMHIHPGNTSDHTSSDHADHVPGGPAAPMSISDGEVAVGRLAAHHPFECLRQWRAGFNA